MAETQAELRDIRQPPAAFLLPYRNRYGKPPALTGKVSGRVPRALADRTKSPCVVGRGAAGADLAHAFGVLRQAACGIANGGWLPTRHGRDTARSRPAEMAPKREWWMIRAQGVPIVEIDLAAVREELGRRVAAKRVALGMSQAELGHRIGMTFQQVQKYERGRNSMSVTGMLAICAALDWSAEELLDGLHPPALSPTERYSARRRAHRPHSRALSPDRRAAVETDT